MATKLFVGGLSYSTTSESLREYFAQCGTVESATVITDRATGQSRGFGFVEMATEAEGQAAISKLNDKPFEGRRLTVNVANPQGAGAAVDAPAARAPVAPGRVAGLVAAAVLVVATAAVRAARPAGNGHVPLTGSAAQPSGRASAVAR